MIQFHNLPFDDEIINLEYYCTEFGLYTSDKDASDFGKVPTPSVSEIQEAEIDSILSFREVLNFWCAFYDNFTIDSYCPFLYKSSVKYEHLLILLI